MGKVHVGGDFALVDHDGRAVMAATYRGRHMLIFFGFTHCRKVCPETLAKLSRVLDTLEGAADSIQPLYVSVDPDRDTPEVMKAFLKDRYPRFFGLTGDRLAIDAVRSAYKVYAERAPDEEDPRGYAVPHSALVYVTDRDGDYLFHFGDGAPEEVIAKRLGALCKSNLSRGVAAPSA